MFFLQVVTSGVLTGFVQGTGGHEHYTQFRALSVLGLDACLDRDKLKKISKLPSQALCN